MRAAPRLDASPSTLRSVRTMAVAASGYDAPVTRKKLTSYVGFANLPNQVHRSCVRKGFNFTAMVVGA